MGALPALVRQRAPRRYVIVMAGIFSQLGSGNLVLSRDRPEYLTYTIISKAGTDEPPWCQDVLTADDVNDVDLRSDGETPT